MARYCPLFSGSSGNCTYVGTPEGGILIDVGVSASRIENALRMRGIDPCSIQAIFITHEHSDHIAGLRVLTKRYGYRVYASEGTLDALAASSAMDAKALCESIGGEGEVKETAGMAVMAFHTSHDSRESLGFRIHLPDGRRIAVATDTGYVPSAVREALLGCDLIQIESNHDVRMLENGPYPYYLKRRILAATGHLSNGLRCRTGGFRTRRNHTICSGSSEPRQQFAGSCLYDLPHGTVRRRTGRKSRLYTAGGSPQRGGAGDGVLV